MARDETGKLARADAETSGGWRATKRENWHGRMRKRTSGGWRVTKRENWHGRGGNDARMARDETGKLARADAETTSEDAGRSMLTDHSNKLNQTR